MLGTNSYPALLNEYRAVFIPHKCPTVLDCLGTTCRAGEADLRVTRAYLVGLCCGLALTAILLSLALIAVILARGIITIRVASVATQTDFVNGPDGGAASEFPDTPPAGAPLERSRHAERVGLSRPRRGRGVVA